MTEILATFENTKDGVMSLVVKGDRGFNVVLKDTDADEIVGVAIIYCDLERAIDKARRIVG